MARDDVLVVGISQRLGELDAGQAQDFATHFVLAQVLEPPMAVSAPGSFTPRLLAGNFRMQTSFRKGIARFEARVDTSIRFSDGSFLAAEDVAATIRRVAGSDVDVETRADRVLVEGPDTLDLGPLLAGPHAHVFRPGARFPLGTGPYRVTHRDPGLVRVEAWEGARLRARTPVIEFRVYPPDPAGRPTALIDAVEGGEVDITMDLSRRDAKGLTRARKVFLPGASTALLWFGCARPAFRDPLVRRAVAHAIDPYAVAATCFDNPAAFVATSVLPRAMAVSGLASLRHDPAKARDLLERAGGLPPRLSMLSVWGPRPYLPRPREAASAVAGQLEGLGVELDVTFADSASDYLDKIRSGRFDLVLGGWIADGPDPVEFLRAIASSDRILGERKDAAVAAANYGAYRSEAFDAALRSSAALADRLRRACAILAEEVPLVPLMHSATVVALSRRVEGFDPERPVIVPELAGLRVTA